MSNPTPTPNPNPVTSFKMPNISRGQYFYITLSIVIFIVLLLFSWVANRLSLKTRSCNKLNIYWPTLTNTTYFNSPTTNTSGATTNTSGATVKTGSGFGIDSSHNKLINYHVKSAYNCCCGDGYKNNFVALCALEKCIANGCRFLDFEIYSYNNEPIIAASTANSNYIKETYNSLSLEEVLITIKEKAFNLTYTNCANDPLILNFRVMSTNLAMLKKMGDLIEKHLADADGVFTLETRKGPNLIFMEMSELYRKVIIICEFNPLPSIIDTNADLSKLKDYINLKAKGLFCNTFRYNQIASKKGSLSFIESTKTKYTIVLPNLDNSIINFDPALSFDTGCQAICMKHQNMDNSLLGYNALFKTKQNYCWFKKSRIELLNIDIPSVPDTTNLGVNPSF
uniref:PI-PLC Y-box domain-containing protein n=1 Tax=viral metagenome TaxID=1070528 RepID=A0A6C0KNI0_9ZZZZ